MNDLKVLALHCPDAVVARLRGPGIQLDEDKLRDGESREREGVVLGSSDSAIVAERRRTLRKTELVPTEIAIDDGIYLMQLT
jgi:hypothetical protein